MALRREEDGSYSWTTEYEKTWEVLQEDEDGSLQATIDDIIQKARRKRLLIRRGNVRLGMMRHLFIVLDMSKAMEESDLLKPSRLACAGKLLEYFILEYFDQNPISQIGVLVTKNKRAEKISDMSGNPKVHISNIKESAAKGCIGEPSLQNALEGAISVLRHLPSHTSKEILVIYGSLTTCDPGNIFDTIKILQEQNIRCSVIGLSAEIHICKKLCRETQGTYGIVLDERHFKDLLVGYVRPPEAKVNSEASLIRMGFPTHTTNGLTSFCICHIESKAAKGLGKEGYYCPQCRSKYCELPVECKICGLTLVCAPHLARSYQHLFPLAAFDERKTSELPNEHDKICCGCQAELVDPITYVCPSCGAFLCTDCDIFTHETLHICPGCSSGVDAVGRLSSENGT